MFDSIIQLLLLLTIISTSENIPMNCYSNAGINPFVYRYPYNNLTLHSCLCLMIPETMSAFQYDSSDNSCYIFVGNLSRSDLQVRINSVVCFVNRTSTSSTSTSSSTTTLPLSPAGVSTSVGSSNYYATESIVLTNNVTLTSLSILIIAPKTFGATGMDSYTTFPSGAINKTINETNNTIRFTFELLNGSTIPFGQWYITAQYTLIGQARPTSNDTYTIRIQPYQDIVGHF